MTIRIDGIRNCDTMKKAFARLAAKGVAYEFHDYQKGGVLPLASSKPDRSRAAGSGSLTRAARRGGRFPRLGAKLLVGFDPTEFGTAIR
ncbi:MAG: hypothetical protein O3A91_05615 [Proteobacteria bacterium]|nr:hypothetical protein [Pseudomonadota bacterium]